MDEFLRELPQKILNWLNQKWKYPATKDEFEVYLQQKKSEKFKRIEAKQKREEEMSEEKQREILVRTLQESEVDLSRFEDRFERGPISRPRRPLKIQGLTKEAIELSLQLSVDCCKKKCPNYQERPQTPEEKRFYWKLIFTWLLSGKDASVVKAEKDQKDPNDLGMCFMNCLAKYSTFQELIRKEMKVSGEILPPMTVRVDESQIVKALFDPLKFYILKDYNGKKHFVPTHIKNNPLVAGDPSDHPGLYSPNFHLERPEPVKKVYTTRPVY